MLYSHSPVFRKMLGGDFQVRRPDFMLPLYMATNVSQEASQDRIVVKDDPEALNIMLSFMYSTYSEGTIPQDTKKPMSFLVEVFTIADKYDVEQLRIDAIANLARVLNPTDNLADYMEAIRTVATVTVTMTGPMWEVVIASIRNNSAYLSGKSEFMDLMFDLPDLMMLLLGQLGGAQTLGDGYGGRALGGYSGGVTDWAASSAPYRGGGRRLG